MTTLDHSSVRTGPFQSCIKHFSRIALVLALVTCFLIPSSSSVETDEAFTGIFARSSSLVELYKTLNGLGGSDRQMPLTTFLDYAYGKIAGTSEWELRSINIFWGIVLMSAFFQLGQKLKMSWLPLLMAVQPFYWYYMDQARPYAMQIALSSWVLYAVVECLLEDGFLSSTNAFVFFLCGFLLSASTMMGFIAYIPYGMMLCWLVFRSKRRLEKQTLAIASVGLFLLFILGLYYLGTLSSAGGAKVHAVGIGNLIYPIYELAGFSGLGMDRLALRSLSALGFRVIIPKLIPYLLFLFSLAIVYIFLAIGYIRSQKKQPHQSFLLHAIVIISTIFFFVFTPAIAVKFPVWGRHFAAAFPSMVLVIGLMIEQSEKSIWKRIVVGLLFVLLLFSSLRLRFDSEYAREDFRTATAVATEALGRNETVWWCGMPFEAGYYRLPIAGGSGEPNKVFLIGSSQLQHGEEEIKQLPSPDWIIICERLADVMNSKWLYRYVEENGYQKAKDIKGFSVYRKTPAPAAN